MHHLNVVQNPEPGSDFRLRNTCTKADDHAFVYIVLSELGCSSPFHRAEITAHGAKSVENFALGFAVERFLTFTCSIQIRSRFVFCKSTQSGYSKPYSPRSSPTLEQFSAPTNC